MRPLFADIQTRDRLLLRLARGPLGGLALVLLCCTVYLPGFFSIPPVDRDESRFAQASRQMFESVALPESQQDPELHSGGLAVPRVGGKDRLNKPPLIYWLQAGSAALFTGGDPLKDAIWMYRVPSLLAGIVIVLATWRLGCSMFDPRAGWMAAVLLTVSPVFVWEAHQARADMVMVAFTTLAMVQLWRIWHSCSLPRAPRGRAGEGGLFSPRSNRTQRFVPLLLWLFVTLGILTKGPITPMVVVLTALFLSIFARNFRWLRTTRPLLGLAIIIAGVGPWVYAVAQQVGFSHYWSIIYDEVFARAGSAKEGHWGPPGYHLVLLVVLFWPGSLLTGLSIARAWRRGCSMSPKRERRADGTDLSEGREDTVEPTGRLRSRLCGFWTYLVSLRITRRPEAFLLAWLLPTWIVFELVSTKLPHYTMPMYPAVALMTARGVLAAAGSGLRGTTNHTTQIGFALWSLIMVLLVLGLVVSALGAVIYSEFYGAHQASTVVMFVGIIVAVFAGWKTLQAIWSQLWIQAHARVVVFIISVYIVLLGNIAPNTLGLTDRLYSMVQYYDETGDRPIATAGFFEDSIAFLWRNRVEHIDTDGADAWLDAHPDGLLIVPHDIANDMARADILGGVYGFRYSKGKTVFLSIVELGTE